MIRLNEQQLNLYYQMLGLKQLMIHDIPFGVVFNKYNVDNFPLKTCGTWIDKEQKIMVQMLSESEIEILPYPGNIVSAEKFPKWKGNFDDSMRKLKELGYTVPRVKGVKICKPIKTKFVGQFPLVGTVIKLDMTNTMRRKLHQIIYQQGSHYGSVGDMCDYISHPELFELERNGYIKIIS